MYSQKRNLLGGWGRSHFKEKVQFSLLILIQILFLLYTCDEFVNRKTCTGIDPNLTDENGRGALHVANWFNKARWPQKKYNDLNIFSSSSPAFDILKNQKFLA
jgi:hypothetical protein